jgi:3-oxoacid CoA-transferase A subunit
MAAVIEAIETALARVRDGDVVMVGGFGLSGTPLRLIEGLVTGGRKDLTIISNNLGEPGRGLGALLREGRVSHARGSFFTGNPEVAQHARAGNLTVELIPQGTLAEAIRAGGAGIPAFYTPTAANTDLANGKETRVFEDGRTYVLERAIHADVALIKAWKADRLGNLVYRKTARNFNPLMATAAELVIAEVEELVGVGELQADAIVTPHVFVDVLVVGGSDA